jgi:uncharacterized low-complexity protein
MSKKTITPVAAVVGAALVGSLSAVELASAEENPFAATAVETGYMQIAGAEGSCGGEGSCGEGKCGSEGDDDGDGDA